MIRPRDHRSGRRVRKLAALVIIHILVLAGTAQANHGERTIDASPEDHTAFIGFSQQLTVTLSSAPTVADGTINVDFENEDGVNDTDGDTPTTPDKSCAIAAGNVSCSVGYAGLVRGSDLWRVWIDHDGLDSTFEADEVEAAADGEAANDTDVLDLFWEIGPPAMLDCDDSTGPDTERETNPAGRSDGGTLPGGNPPVVGGGDVSNETYTCRVFDSGRYPVSATVYGEVVTGVNDPDSATGASASYNTPDYQCTTDSSNMCEILVTQNRSQKGTSQVCFWIVDTIPGSTTPALDTPAKSCDGSGESLNEAQTTALDDPANDLAD
ncbi:MAG: hypothetical protein ACRDKZ_12960, partial [Actinomycetota bacterium]